MNRRTYMKFYRLRAFTVAEVLVALGIIGILCVSMLSLNSMSDNNYKEASTKLAQVDSALKSWGKAISKSNETGIGAKATITTQNTLNNSILEYFDTDTGKGLVGIERIETREGDTITGKGNSIILKNGVRLDLMYSGDGTTQNVKGADYNPKGDRLATIVASINVKGKDVPLNEEYALLTNGLSALGDLYEGWTKYTYSPEKTSEHNTDGSEKPVRYYCSESGDCIPGSPDDDFSNIYMTVDSVSPCSANQTGYILTQRVGTIRDEYTREENTCCDAPRYFIAHDSAGKNICECDRNKMTFAKGEVFDETNAKCVVKAEPGSYAIGGARIYCDEGYYCKEEGADAPIACPKGYYCPDSTNAADKDNYHFDKYVKDNDGNVTALLPKDKLDGKVALIDKIICPAGKYCPNEHTTTPITCPVGTYCAAGADTPTLCPAGTTTYKLDNNRIVYIDTQTEAAACKKCPKNTYAPAAGSTECLPCPNGQWSNEGATSCSGCPAGEFFDTQTQKCTKCKVGTYQDTTGAVDACKPCPDGQYQNQEGQSSCKDCPDNSRVPARDADGKIKDAHGIEIEPTSISACRCVGGYGLHVLGRNAQGARNPVPQGTALTSIVLTESNRTCQIADNDEYSPMDDNIIYPCRKNSHTWYGKGSANPTECVCDNGYYFDLNENNYDNQCKNDKCAVYSFRTEKGAPENERGNGNNPMVQLGFPSDWPVVKRNAKVSYYECPSYTYTDGKTTAYESGCLSPKNNPAYANTHIIKADRCGVVACSTIRPNTVPDDTYTACVCKPGYTLVGNECKPCAVGTFKPIKGNQECTPCNSENVKPHSTTQGTGSTSQLQCLCDLGYELVNGVCRPCKGDVNGDTGTYKDFVGDEACPACSRTVRQHSTTLQDGSTSPNQCLCVKGYKYVQSSFRGGKISEVVYKCEPCEVNKYKDVVSNATTCTPCPSSASPKWQSHTNGQTARTSINECLCPWPYWVKNPNNPPFCICGLTCDDPNMSPNFECNQCKCDLTCANAPSGKAILNCKYANCPTGQYPDPNDCHRCIQKGCGQYVIPGEASPRACGANQYNTPTDNVCHTVDAGYVLNADKCGQTPVCPNYGKLYVMSIASGALNRSVNNLMAIGKYSPRISPDRMFDTNKNSGYCTNSEWTMGGCQNATVPSVNMGAYVLSQYGYIIRSVPRKVGTRTNGYKTIDAYGADANGPAISGLKQFFNRSSNGATCTNGCKLYILGSDGVTWCEYTGYGYYRNNSPLVLDLMANGLNFTSLEDGVEFDLNGDGTTEHISWTAEQTEFDNAFLVYDQNGNGQVDSGKELFGDQNGEENGFKELAKYDSNGDGVITPVDDMFDELLLWVDFNKNAQVDYTDCSVDFENIVCQIAYTQGYCKDENNCTLELQPLNQVGVSSISTEYVTERDDAGQVKKDEHGNIVGYVGSFLRNIQDAITGLWKQITGKMIDVFFRVQEEDE